MLSLLVKMNEAIFYLQMLVAAFLLVLNELSMGLSSKKNQRIDPVLKYVEQNTSRKVLSGERRSCCDGQRHKMFSKNAYCGARP